MDCTSLIVKMTPAEIESATNVNAELEFAGGRWWVEALVMSKNLCVFVKSDMPKSDMEMSVAVDVLDQNASAELFYESNINQSRGYKVMPWQYITVDKNGQLTIRVKFSKVMPPVPLSIEKIAYPDLVLTCENVEFPCNMCVVAVKSEYIRNALENKDNWANKDTLSIEHESATPEILLLVLTAIYDGWQTSMDKHASRILLLADYMLADVVVDMAVKSMKHQLSSNTFWHFCTVSAMVPHRHELLKACATFASTPTTSTVFALLNRPDGKAIALDKNNDTIRTLSIAVAQLHEQ